MPTGDSAAELLAAGAEALTEAAFRTGEYAGAAALLRAALGRAEADGDRAVEAAALDRLGWLLHFGAIDRGLERADADAEEALFQRALTIRRELGDPAGTAASLFGVGLVHQVLRRDWVTAMPYFREALALAEEHGDELTRSEVHRHIGFSHLVHDGQLDEALRHLRISLDLREQRGDPRWTPSGTLALGQAQLVAGNRAEAVRLLRAAVRQSREAGLRQRRIEQAEDWLRRAESGEVPDLR
jgi:tetratricopeptide (TPR) repeat protein